MFNSQEQEIIDKLDNLWMEISVFYRQKSIEESEKDNLIKKIQEYFKTCHDLYETVSENKFVYAKVINCLSQGVYGPISEDPICNQYFENYWIETAKQYFIPDDIDFMYDEINKELDRTNTSVWKIISL